MYIPCISGHDGDNVGLLKGMLMMLAPGKSEYDDCEDNMMALNSVGGLSV